MNGPEFIFSFDRFDRFKRFQELFYRLKESQPSQSPDASSNEWLDYYDDKALEYFWQDGEDIWDFESMIHAIHLAEYSLISCEIIDTNQAKLIFEEVYYGLDALFVLIVSYGFPVISGPYGLKP